MFFSIKNNYNTSPDLFKIKTYQLARTIILLYPEKSAEKKLNQYLLKTYKMPLKLICLGVLQNGTLMKDNNNNFVVIFRNQKWDKLAKLITYGTGVIQGSNILKHAFNSL